MRKQMLDIAHEGHPGIVSMKQNLRTRVWWPGIDKDAEQFCKTCYGCQLVGRPTPPEPMTRTELPSAPWDYLAADLLGPLPNTQEYIFVVIDYYSRFVELEVTKSTTSEKLIQILRKIFSRHGLPHCLQTDNGSCFVSEQFEHYLEENGIMHRKTTPLWPSANGQIERINSSILKRIRIAEAEKRNWKTDLDTYMLMYRSSPHATTGVSPAELLYGRKIRSKIPQLQEYRSQDSEIRDRDCERKEKGKVYSDRKRNARDNDIQTGDKVLLRQNRRDKLDTKFGHEPFTVKGKYGNSVTIEKNGVQYKRNITHVKKYLDRNANRPENTTTPLINTHPNDNARRKNSENRRSKREIKQPAKYRDY